MGHQKKAKKQKKQYKRKTDHSEQGNAEAAIREAAAATPNPAVAKPAAPKPAAAAAAGPKLKLEDVDFAWFNPGSVDSKKCISLCWEWDYDHCLCVAKWDKRPESEPGMQRRGCFATDAGGRIVGVLFGQVNHDLTMHNEVEIIGLVVHPQARRQGIGAELLEFAANWARYQRVEKLIGEIYPSAMPFYKRLGWVDAGFGSTDTPEVSAALGQVAQLLAALGDGVGAQISRNAIGGGLWMKKMLA